MQTLPFTRGLPESLADLRNFVHFLRRIRLEWFRERTLRGVNSWVVVVRSAKPETASHRIEWWEWWWSAHSILQRGSRRKVHRIHD
jgi:hypothetical protein